MSDKFYRAFEDRHRGSRETIKARLRAYTPFLLPLANGGSMPAALDLGCGRGEWLELLREHGFNAQGVDLDEGMLAACRERGLRVRTEDALTSLRGQSDASLALVSAFHLIEHIPFDAVQELIVEALRVLQPGGLLILETPNPENLVVATSGFYMDPSHLKPIPPMLLDFVVDFAGFPRHKIVRLQEPAELHGQVELELINLLNGVSADFSVVAQKTGPDAVMAAFETAFAAPFGIELAELSSRYQHQQHASRAAIKDDVARVDARVVAVEASFAERDATVQQLDARVDAVEAGTASLFKRTLDVVEHATAATQQAQADLTEAIHRERTMVERARALESRMHDLQDKVGERERHALRLEAELEERERHALDLQAALEERERHAARTQAALDEGERHALRLQAAVEEREQLLVSLRAEAEERERQLQQDFGVRFDAAEHAVREQQTQHMQWLLDVANARTAAAEHSIVLLHASASWRFAAPLRFAGRVARAVARGTALGSVRRRVVHALRPLAARAVRGIIGNGRLARYGMRFLASRPGLKTRLRRLIGSPSSLPGSGANTGTDRPAAGFNTTTDGAPPAVTPRAEQLFTALRKAAAERKN